MKQLVYIFALAFIVCTSACQQGGGSSGAASDGPAVETKDDQAKTDNDLIVKHIAENMKGKSVKNTASGIYYVIDKEGSGVNPKITDRVKVHYRGKLLDGTEFDSSYSRNKPTEFPLRGVIKGWQEAIPMLKTGGGKGTFYIPSAIAYGARRVGAKIEPNSVLIFEVELLDITTPTQNQATPGHEGHNHEGGDHKGHNH
ncbi:MAG: FKBP-type peptidyl-prolyl cis-trans isomerase [Chitinophagales bacterium]